MKSIAAILSLFTLCFVSQAQHAEAGFKYIVVQSQFFDGTRNTEVGGGLGTGGVDGAGGWSGIGNNGFEIDWFITENFNGSQGLFQYVYTISGENGSNLSKALSHWILGLSPTIDWGPDGIDVDFGGFTEVKTPGTTGDSFGPGNSNPGIPGLLAGVKWDRGNDDGSPTSFSFETYQIPIWGSFYAKDGKDGGDETFAFNEGFDTYNTAFPTEEAGFDPADFDVIPWIAVPDTEVVANIIPEPSSFSLSAVSA